MLLSLALVSAVAAASIESASVILRQDSIPDKPMQSPYAVGEWPIAGARLTTARFTKKKR